MKKGGAKMLLTLFLTMTKIGLFTFGGGYAMIALLENEFVSKRGWMDKDEFLNLVAIAESTPGPIAINASTYIGYKQAGVLGSIAATVGVCLPSFVIIYLISLFFDAFLSLTLVARAFRGIQVGVIYLIGAAGVKMYKGLPKKALPLTLFGVTLCALTAGTLWSVKFSSVYYILLGGAVGVLAYLIGKARKTEKEENV